MALIGYVYSLAPGSSTQLAKLLSFTILPVFLIGPVAGVYVDRWDRRRTMFVCDFLRAVLVLLIPLFLLSRDSLGLIYLLIFIIFSIGRFFVPAKLSVIPELVKKEELLIANSLVNTSGMIAAIAGFGIAGLVVQYLKAAGGFYLDALSFFVSAMLIFFIRPRRIPAIKIKQVGREIVEVIQKSVIQEIKEGIIYFFKHKQVRFTGAIMFFLGAACGAIYIVMIVFIQKTLKSATLDLGFLIMFLGLGLFIGSLIYGRFGQGISGYKAIILALILTGLILGIFALGVNRYPYFFVAAPLIFILGLSISPIIIASNTLIHKDSHNEMMGRVFSSLEFLLHLSFIAFMFLSSFLAERISALVILVVAAGLFILLGLISLNFQRKIVW